MISYSKSIKQARFFNRMESPFIQWKRKSRQLKSFCKTIAQRTGYDSAATSAVEIAQELDIDPSFPPSRSGKKRRLFDYQGEEEQRATPELKFKSNFFYPLVDQAMMSIKERFNLLREVSSAFSFLYTRDKLLLVQQENALLTCCKEFQKKFGDIDSDEMSAELQRFVLILQKKNAISIRLKTF